MPAPIWDQEVQFSKASVLFLKARTWFTSSTQSGIHFFDEQGNEGHLHVRLGKRHFLAVHFGYVVCDHCSLSDEEERRESKQRLSFFTCSALRASVHSLVD